MVIWGGWNLDFSFIHSQECQPGEEGGECDLPHRQKLALNFGAERDHKEHCTRQEHGAVERGYTEETLEDFTLQASNPEAALLL